MNTTHDTAHTLLRKNDICPRCNRTHHMFQFAPSSTVRVADCGTRYMTPEDEARAAIAKAKGASL